MNWIKEQWNRIPLAWRMEITSFAHTFFSTALTMLVLQYQSGQFPVGKDALTALAMAVARSAWKAAFTATFIKPQE